MLSVALVEPEIPPNTGNVARLCAAANVPLHIVGVTGFRMDDRALRRAGLDYWPEVQLARHANLDRALSHHCPQRASFISPPKPIASTPIGSSSLTIASFLAGKHAVYPKICCAQTGTIACVFRSSIQTFAASISPPLSASFSSRRYDKRTPSSYTASECKSETKSET